MSEKITKKFGVFGETEEKKAGYYISVENDQENCTMNMEGNGTPLSQFLCDYVRVTEETRDAFKFLITGVNFPLLLYITKYAKVFVEPGKDDIKNEDVFDLDALYHKLCYIDEEQDSEYNAVLKAISERNYENSLTCALSDHVALSIFVPSPDFLKNLDDPCDKFSYKRYYAIYNYNMDEESKELIIIGEKYVQTLTGSTTPNYMEYSVYCIEDFDSNDEDPYFDYAYGLYRSVPLYKNTGIHKLIPIIESYQNKMIKYNYNQYRNGTRFEYAECYHTYAGLKLGISTRINPVILTKKDGKIGLNIPHLFTLLNGDNSGHFLFYYDDDLFDEEIIMNSYNSRGEARILSEESTITVDVYDVYDAEEDEEEE